jgi:microcystin-dependent protein
MSSVFFDNASRIIKAVLDWLQSGSHDKTSNLIIDTFQVGIDNATGGGEGFTLVPGTSPLSVTVQGQGIAYDSNGARIFIDVSDTTPYNPANVTQTTDDGLGNMVLTPQSSGCVNIPLTANSFNYLWMDYLATTDVTTFTLNKITKAKIFYKLMDGYNIQVTTVNVPPDSTSVFLGTIDLTGIFGGIISPSTISQLGRTYFNILPDIIPITTAQADRSDATATYNPASKYTLDAHIKAVGTSPTGVSPTNPHATTLADLGVSTLDTVVAHRQLEHGTIQSSGNAAANAIIAGVPGTPSPSTSAMATSINIVNPGSDYLTVFFLLATEFAIVNGTAYNITDIFGGPSNATIFFPDASGTYNVYWDSTVKAFASTISDISSDVTKLWIATVTYTFVGHGGSDHNVLSALIDRRRVGSTTHLLQRWITNARPGSGSTVAASGEFGFNLTTNLLEYWDGGAWQQPVLASANATVPAGAMVDFAGVSAPTGWLLCDGSVVSQTTYANLYTAIGIIWNTGGEGAGNFRLPDFRRKVAVGSGGVGSGTLGNTVGSTGGEEDHTLTTAELAVHNHSANSSVSDPGHQHRFGHRDNTGSFPQTNTGFRGDSSDITNYFETNTVGTGISVSTSVGNAGSGTAHNNLQPSCVVTKVIKY